MRTPPSDQVELRNKIFVVEKLFHQRKACVDGLLGVVDFNFQLWIHL
jgi:hypothetical protein